MKAEIKAILSPDIQDLAKYTPENSEIVGFALQLLIGPHGQEGMESFQLTVCTPQWLSVTYSKDQIIVGRHYLIIFEYDYERLLHFMHSYVERCTGETWQEIATKLVRFGQWDFEDYEAGERN